MKCPNCDAKLFSEFSYCKICGYELNNRKELQEKSPHPTKITSKDIVKHPPKVVRTKSNPQLYIGSILLAFLVVVILLFTVILPFIKDINADRMFVIASNLFIRSSMFTESQSNVLKKAPYGTRVLVYKRYSEWAEVKYNDITGYMSIEFLLDEKDFFTLNYIFGNEYAKDLITLTKHKKALLNYFKSNRIMGNIPLELQKKIYGRHLTNTIWQIIGLNLDNEFNSVTKGNYSGNEIKDLACIITNIESKLRKILIFSFDEKNNSFLNFERLIGENDYIKTVTKGSGKYYQGKSWKEYLKTDAILIRSNNSSQTVRKKLIVYNGTRFNVFNQ